jgi:hypothetical protein
MQCLSMEDVLKTFNVSESIITRSDFYQLCPALVQQAAIGCKYTAPASSSSSTPTTAESEHLQMIYRLVHGGQALVLTIRLTHFPFTLQPV